MIINLDPCSRISSSFLLLLVSRWCERVSFPDGFFLGVGLTSGLGDVYRLACAPTSSVRLSHKYPLPPSDGAKCSVPGCEDFLLWTHGYGLPWRACRHSTGQVVWNFKFGKLVKRSTSRARTWRNPGGSFLGSSISMQVDLWALPHLTTTSAPGHNPRFASSCTSLLTCFHPSLI